MAYNVGIRKLVYQEPCLQAAWVQRIASLVNIPNTSECSGVIAYSRSASSTSASAGMGAFSYNAFIFKPAKPHPHTPTNV